MATLSASERTGVAIARALREDPEYPACLLVLDEPTATLPVDEVDHLLDRVSAMAATGVGVLYVTHHLGEIFRVAHKVSVFRDGVVVGAGPVSDFDHAGIVYLLAGEELIAEETEARRQKAARAAAREHETVFEVKDLRAGALAGVSFSVERGEIVGIAGLAGLGPRQRARRQLRRAPRAPGEVTVAGAAAPACRPDVAIGRGRRLRRPRPQDRRCRDDDERPGEPDAAQPQAVLEGRGFCAAGARRRRTKEWFERLSVRPANAVDEPLSIFSGGNQQKILFGKWLSQEPTVFLLDEPTQGVDVGAKADLHRELITAAEAGAAVVVSSSDLEELADLCDRVLVIVDGRISAELAGAELTEGAITRRFMPISAVPAEADGANGASLH